MRKSAKMHNLTYQLSSPLLIEIGLGLPNKSVVGERLCDDSPGSNFFASDHNCDQPTRLLTSLSPRSPQTVRDLGCVRLSPKHAVYGTLTHNDVQKLLHRKTP